MRQGFLILSASQASLEMMNGAFDQVVERSYVEVASLGYYVVEGQQIQPEEATNEFYHTVCRTRRFGG